MSTMTLPRRAVNAAFAIHLVHATALLKSGCNDRLTGPDRALGEQVVALTESVLARLDVVDVDGDVRDPQALLSVAEMQASGSAIGNGVAESLLWPALMSAGLARLANEWTSATNALRALRYCLTQGDRRCSDVAVTSEVMPTIEYIKASSIPRVAESDLVKVLFEAMEREIGQARAVVASAPKATMGMSL